MFDQTFIRIFGNKFKHRAARAVLFAAMFVCIFSLQSFAAPGDLDATFGTGGDAPSN